MKTIHKCMVVGFLTAFLMFFVSYTVYAADEETLAPAETEVFQETFQETFRETEMSSPVETSGDGETETAAAAETQEIPETNPETAGAEEDAIRIPKPVYLRGQTGAALVMAPFSLGQTGMTWGMYPLLETDVTVDIFGPNPIYTYSHIIQTGADFSEITQTAYCIQYGVACPPGSYPTESDFPVGQQNYLGYALQYGWKQSGNSYDESQYENYRNRTEYLVTQGIIWACTMDIFGTDAADQAIGTLIDHSFDPEHGRSYYENLKGQILEAEKIPSFSGGDRETAPEILLEWHGDKQRYEATVMDVNGVLDRFDYVGEGIQISRQDNRVTFSVEKNLPSDVIAEAVHSIQGGAGAVVVWDGESGNQDLATYREAEVQVSSYVRLKTEGLGGIRIRKVSSDPELTEDNAVYNLSGAVYGIYRDGEEVGRITTDEKGEGQLDGLRAGDYTIKEISAPPGFALNVEACFVAVSPDQTTILEVKDKPQRATIELLLEKRDRQTDKNEPLGAGTLENAEFTIKYYDVLSETDPEAEGRVPLRTWVMKTNAEGQCRLEEAFKVEGDPFYVSDGVPVLPAGTVTIQETKAPEGYLLNEEIYVRQIIPAGAEEVIETYVEPVIWDQVIRGDFEFIKNGEDGSPMAGIPFRITSQKTGENFTVYSDQKGRVTTEDLWFGEGEEDGSLGGLPYGIYTVEELPCVENEDKILAAPFDVKIESHNEVVNLGIVQNFHLPSPELDSIALGRETGDHRLPAEASVGIIERLECKNLLPGIPFTLKVKVVDPDTGSTWVIGGKELTKEMTFIAENQEEVKEFQFDFSAVGLQGKRMSVAAELFRRGAVVATHNLQYDDPDQTIEVEEIKISTAAVDEADGDQRINLDLEVSEVAIRDVISYENLIPGRSYRAEGILMDKSTGEVFCADGKPVTGTTEFIPEELNGTVEVIFTFSPMHLGNGEIVVFEKLFNSEGEIIAVHEDLEDQNQTIELERPENRKPLDSPKTGDRQPVWPAAVVGGISAVVLIFLLIIKRERK